MKKHLSKFDYNGLKVIFKKQYVIKYRIKDGMLVFHDENLGIQVQDETFPDLLESFKDMFVTLWRMYVDKADSELSKGAKKFKEYLKGICMIENAKLK